MYIQNVHTGYKIKIKKRSYRGVCVPLDRHLGDLAPLAAHRVVELARPEGPIIVLASDYVDASLAEHGPGEPEVLDLVNPGRVVHRPVRWRPAVPKPGHDQLEPVWVAVDEDRGR